VQVLQPHKKDRARREEVLITLSFTNARLQQLRGELTALNAKVASWHLSNACMTIPLVNPTLISLRPCLISQLRSSALLADTFLPWMGFDDITCILRYTPLCDRASTYRHPSWWWVTPRWMRCPSGMASP